VLFQEPHPFDFLLVEAEEASGAGARVGAFDLFAVHVYSVGGRQVVGRDAHPRGLEDVIDVVDDQILGVVEQWKGVQLSDGVVRAFEDVVDGMVECDRVEIDQGLGFLLERKREAEWSVC